MRASLKKSIADAPEPFERYPKGSIVLCNACALPLYKLEQGIDLGDKAGRSAQRFKPLGLADLVELAGRPDIDAGIRAIVRSWTLDQQRAHIQALTAPKSGEPMVCPICAGCWVQVLTVEQADTLDRAYVLELLTIPPFGSGRPAPVRGRQFHGVRGDWVH